MSTSTFTESLTCGCRDRVPRIDYSDDKQTLRERLTEAFRSHGVVVLENVFSPAECDSAMEQLVDSFHTINPAVTRSPKTWKQENLPSGPKPGMFHSLVSHLPIVWRIRSDDRMWNIFHHAYSGLRGQEVTRLVTSCDGASIKPFTQPYADPDKDWAHVDQTEDTNNVDKCIQGQAVLTNTSAAFRCSPKSHHFLQEFLDLDGGPRCASSNYHRFSDDVCNAIRSRVTAEGGAYQTCVHAPKGSVILWLSSVIHSAKAQDKHASVDPEDPWSQWRGVLYICHRPREDVHHGHTAILETAFAANGVTSHWGSKMFTKPRARDRALRTATLARLLSDPQAAFSMPELRPPRTARVHALLQGEPWPTHEPQPPIMPGNHHGDDDVESNHSRDDSTHHATPVV